MKPRSPSPVLRIGAAFFALTAAWFAWALWKAGQTGQIDTGRHLAALADDAGDFWLKVCLHGLSLIVCAVLAVAFWKGADGERQADSIMARRDIPLDRAVRAQQDPEA